jgi:hypothetical protein
VIGIAGTLLQAGFELRNPRLHGPDPFFLLHNQLPDHQRRLFPRGGIQRQPVWTRDRVGHGILSWIMNMNLTTSGASDAVLIMENPAKHQSKVDGILISVPLTDYPLNSYGV